MRRGDGDNGGDSLWLGVSTVSDRRGLRALRRQRGGRRRLWARARQCTGGRFCNAPADRVAPAGYDPATETFAPPQPAMHLPMATDLTARAPTLAVLVPVVPAGRPGLSCPAMPEPWFLSPIAPCRPARCALSGGGFRHLLRACGACWRRWCDRAAPSWRWRDRTNQAGLSAASSLPRCVARWSSDAGAH